MFLELLSLGHFLQIGLITSLASSISEKVVNLSVIPFKDIANLKFEYMTRQERHLLIISQRLIEMM